MRRTSIALAAHVAASSLDAMKVFLAIALTAGIVVLAGHAEAVGAQYSGKAYVNDLGQIAFPEGKWSLECKRVQQSSRLDEQRREYFVFKRAAAEGERLTIVRYNPFIVPKVFDVLLGEFDYSLGDGLPAEVRGRGVNKGFTLLPTVTRHSPEAIGYSFTTIYPKPRPPWLCHADLLKRDGWAFLFVQASTKVLDPRVITDVEQTSKLLTQLPKGLFVIPHNLVGDWVPVANDTTLLHLSSDGKCAWTSAGIDVMSGGLTGSYEASSHTLTLDGYRYSVDERALTMAPLRFQKSVPASGMDQKFKQSKTAAPLSKQIMEMIYGVPQRD